MADPLAELFIGEAAKDIKDLIVYGLMICPYGFLFFGYNIAIRMGFTALGNYRSASIITIFQEVIISNLVMILLPMIFGIRAVWFVFLVSNAITILVTVFIVYINRDNYGYGKQGLALAVEDI